MSSRTVGPRTITHPVTGEPRLAPKEGTVLRSRAIEIAREHGWTPNDGERDELTDTHELWFTRDDAVTPPIIAKFDKRGRCRFTNACLPARLLLLLAGSCSCEGFVRNTPFEGWRQFVTDLECIVHRKDAA